MVCSSASAIDYHGMLYYLRTGALCIRHFFFIYSFALAGSLYCVRCCCISIIIYRLFGILFTFDGNNIIEVFCSRAVLFLDWQLILLSKQLVRVVCATMICNREAANHTCDKQKEVHQTHKIMIRLLCCVKLMVAVVCGMLVFYH